MNALLIPTQTTVVSPMGNLSTHRVPWFSTPTVTISTSISPSEIDSGLNDNPMAQVQIRDYIHYKFLDKWLFSDFSKLLKYLKVSRGEVSLVKNKGERDSNNIDKSSKEDNELKVDYIENRVLNKNRTKKILTKILEENAIKWYELPHNETVVKHVIGHYVKKELDKLM
jgi:hypothetical protein